MATEEKSRDAFDPTKRYAAVGMQLGRVLVDDDFNEAERIHLEDDRRVQLDVIGPVGSPDEGFLVHNPHATGGLLDFDLAAGTLYLGGLRLWNPTATSFAVQGDWLNQPASARPAATPDRVDLVYLEAWQQPVTAVEDRELYEVALGGPDTSTRLRTMWRVHVAPRVTGSDCPSAWADLIAGWEAAGQGVVDATGERKVDARLEVDYVAGVSGDLCSPAIAGGYLGAENQTVRVQLIDDATLTWGFDNGAPTYRVTVGPDRRTLTFEVDPRDQAHWPTIGQTVELLPWSALLTNGEKTAEETGFLATVSSGFDPVFHTIVLDAGTAVPIGFGEAWGTRPDAGDLAPAFYYLRVWNRGNDPSPPAITYTPGVPLDLGTTGIRITITGDHRIGGDHWIIAARPKTPDQVVPWSLEDGRLVHGTRRFFAPLALVRWKSEDNFVLLHDCRPFFLPLTRLRGCCTHTVGDEVSSFGRFTSIQKAVDALPLEGGKVCILPGTYDETVVLFDRANVTIEGCGARTRWRPTQGSLWTLVAIGGHDLTVRDLTIEAGRAFGIVLFDALKAGANPSSMLDAAWFGFETRQARTRLEHLRIEVLGRSAIAAVGGIDLIVRGCEILAGPLASVIAPGNDLGRWPSILSFADDVLIADNRILARTENIQLPGALSGLGNVTYTRTALGGVQIGGTSERVVLRDNHIEGGNGDGITLGSWAWAPRPMVDEGAGWEISKFWRWIAGISITINAEGCIEIEWDPLPPDDPEFEWVPVSMGPVHDVSIFDNRIRRMGRSGVGVARFFDLSAVDEIIAVRGLHLRGNRIDECLLLPIPTLPVTQRDTAAAGVVLLAEVTDLRMRDNDLIGNGKRHVDPVCGVFALTSQGAIIEHNRIIDNAPKDNDSEEPARPGWRGGVVLLRALPPEVLVLLPEQTPLDDRRVLRQNGEPSARVCDNVIVVPDGRPVLILGAGPMVVSDNHLVTRGVGRADLAQILAGGPAALAAALQTNAVSTLLDLIGGIGALVVNLGLSNELVWLQLLFYLSLRDQDLRPGPGLDPRPPIAASGNVAFHGNQVNIDLLAGPNNVVATAVALFSLDDVLVADNQIEIDRGLDPVVFSVMPIAMSTRVQGNRVKEAGIPSAAFATGASIFSIGIFLNDTTGNQTTRCIIGMGLQRELAPNQVFYQIFNSDLCNEVQGLGARVEEELLITPNMRANPRTTPPGGPGSGGPLITNPDLLDLRR